MHETTAHATFRNDGNVDRVADMMNHEGSIGTMTRDGFFNKTGNACCSVPVGSPCTARYIREAPNLPTPLAYAQYPQASKETSQRRRKFKFGTYGDKVTKDNATNNTAKVQETPTRMTLTTGSCTRMLLSGGMENYKSKLETTRSRPHPY